MNSTYCPNRALVQILPAVRLPGTKSAVAKASRPAGHAAGQGQPVALPAGQVAGLAGLSGLSAVLLQPTTGKLTLPGIRKVRRSILSEPEFRQLGQLSSPPMKHHLIRSKHNRF